MTSKEVVPQSTDPSHPHHHGNTDDIVVHRGLWIERHVNITDVDQSFAKPYVKTVTMDTGVISKGRVSCKVKLSQASFRPRRKHTRNHGDKQSR